jgi:uncharacterized protein
MLNALRHAIARIIAPPTLAQPAAPATPKRRKQTAAQAFLRAAQALPAALDSYKHPTRPEGRLAPDLPPGVVPKAGLAMDAQVTGEAPRMALDMGTSWGFSSPGQAGFGSGFWFPGYPYLAELTQISEYRAPCEMIATEMTRKWFELQSKGGAKNQPDDKAEGKEIAADSESIAGDKSDRIAAITARLNELKVRDLFRRAALLDCEFGRAQIYININDADDNVRQLPLEINKESIAVGSLKSIQCIDPYWSTPYSWNATWPERSDFYKPTSWYIMGRKTHTSRLLTFIGREMPDILKPAYNFSGISLIQLGEQSVNFWLRTRKAVNDLINNYSIPVLSTDLAATLEDGGEPGTGLLARLQAFTLTRNNQSVAAVNKDTEELKFAEATLASLDKLQAQSQEHMAAVWGIPLVKLTGITPSGLNATSEGEIQVWYDRVNAMRINLFEPNLYDIIKVVQLDLDGTIDDDLVIHWVSLDEPTAKELSEIRKSDADAGAGYINAGVISPDEERERLQSDPMSGYENLSGPAPEPEQAMVDPETGEPIDPNAPPGAEGDEEDGPDPSEEADKSRAHESAENDKDRKHEMRMAIKAKTKG